ncbi:hypothetical protein Patl1_29403 [Pistacia atlantica]|uniref:Uncharacterized protein n=1 Tax=Pistacia atlantica TaxID=434234 RepID=A0ACC1AEN2_9ROSI|nr:hypothetical protein Patl1_29403 [Pistacia atlantica]
MIIHMLFVSFIMNIFLLASTFFPPNSFFLFVPISINRKPQRQELKHNQALTKQSVISSRMASKSSQPFLVTRQAPELIIPAEPTPNEVKQLSNIDDQEGIRFHVPFIFFYRNNPSSAMKEKDPVKVIREALSKALVFYYPFAGRAREGSNRKLMVDCNGEGVLFVEANANVTVDDFGPEIQPPFTCLDELMHIVPGSDGIAGCPLMSIQVTRLECGGFILALRWNHSLCDAYGVMQFLKTMEQMIQGAITPSTMPVWQRKLLSARNPPQIDSLRKHLPPHLKNCSTFELYLANVWRCRTAALQLDPDQIVRLSYLTNVNNRSYNFRLPKGYYGNTFAFPAACSKADLLCRRSLGYAVELVKKAKAQMKVDFGWGKAVYGGQTGAISLISFCMQFKNVEGKSGILMPICLPKSTMERFQEELKKMTQGTITEDFYDMNPALMLSRL